MTMLTVRDGVESLKERFSGLASGTGPALAIFIIALSLRFLFLWDVGDSPYYETLVLDAQEYDYLADQLLKGDWRLDDIQTYVHGLLYPLVLALLKLCGLSFGTIQLFQASVGSLSCVFIYRIASHLFTRPVPFIAGLLAAGYWSFIFFNGELMATTQFIFLELWLAFALLRYDKAPSLRRILACGLLLGLLAATRANSLLLLPVIAWWIHSATLPGGKSKRTHWFAIGAMLALTLAPIAIRNQLASGGPLPFQGGWSFYMGTNPAADGTPYVRQGVQWQRHELLPLQAGIVGPPAKGAYYTAAGLRYIADQPVDYIHLLYRKFRLFWHAFEIPVSADMSYYQQHSSLSRVLLLNFGVLIPFALVGMLFGLRRQRQHVLIGGFVLTSLATGLLFTVCARYRLPAVPFLIMFGAHGIWQLMQLARERNLRAAGLFVLLLLFSFTLVHTGVDEQEVDHVRSDLLLGQVYQQTGKFGLAEGHYEAALQKNPDDSDVLSSLGTLYRVRGRYDEAESAFEKAIAVAPDHSRPRLDLASLLLLRRRLEEAGQELERVLEIDPRSVPQYEAHSAMGNLHLRSGAYSLAADSFERALEVRKGTHAYYELSHARGLLGQIEAQLRALEQAVEHDPGFAPALRNLGALYVQRGNYDGGERLLLQSLEYEPLSVAAHQNLGALYLRLGQQQEAELFLARAEELLRNTP